MRAKTTSMKCLPLWVGMVMFSNLALARAARAAGNEPVRVRVAGTLIDEVVRDLLPVALPALAGTAAGDLPPSLTELRYCGATEKGAGRFRAVILLGEGATAFLRGEKTCSQTLAELAKRVPADPESAGAAAIADIEATWKPWELRLVIARMVGLGDAKSGHARLLAGLESRRDILTISTADFHFDTGSGGPVVVHAASSFANAAVDVAIVLGEKSSLTSRGARSGPALPPDTEANVAAEIPTAFVNQLLRLLTWSKPLAIPVNGETIDLQHLSIVEEGAGVAVAGNATPRSIGETVRVTIGLHGEDLAVSAVRAEARLDDCAGQGGLSGIGCNLQNVARSAAADAFASALIQRYQGALVRELASPQEFRFSVAGRRLVLHGAWLRLGFGARGLSATAHLGAGQD
jgi:hypothetical protein